MLFRSHGCDIRVRDKLLNNPDEIVISQRPYDWLGHGMYFWENNYERALQWAEDKKRRGAIVTPAVIGAVLQLGYCCDLTEGGPAFEGSDIMAKTHTQLCIRNFNCIQGFFLPRQGRIFMPWVGATEPRTAA